MKQKIQNLIILILAVNSMCAQSYSFKFDSGLNEDIAGLDATATGTVSFNTDGNRSFAEIRENGYITLDPLLSTKLFENDILRIEFDFRVEQNGGYAVILSTADTGALDIFNYPGFSVLYENDGVSVWFNDQYDWLERKGGKFSDLIINQWHKVRLDFNLVEKSYKFKVNDIIKKGYFANDFDFNSFRNAIQNLHRLTIGGANDKLAPAYDHFFDIDNLLIYTDTSNDAAIEINSAYADLIGDIKGDITLTNEEKESRFDIIKSEINSTVYTLIASSLIEYTQEYEDINPPLYSDGILYSDNELPFHSQVLKYSQQYIFNTQYRNEKDLKSMTKLVFEHHEVIPGPTIIDPIYAPLTIDSAHVEIDGSYATDPAIEFGQQEFVVRPTGYYASPGELVTIEVPSSLVGSGVSVYVGAHFRNMDVEYLGPKTNRFEDISLEYEINSQNIEVLNPLGGGIYFKIPDGTYLGWFNAIIKDAIKSPYYSFRSGRETDLVDWLKQVAETEAPWADFESDKFMFTVPMNLVSGVENPHEIMAKWDEIMDAIRYVGGRPNERIRAEYYIFDTKLVTPAYGAGYPLVIGFEDLYRGDGGNNSWNPLTVLDKVPHETLFHEMGHNHVHPTLNFGTDWGLCHFIEAESIVHTLRMSVLHNVYGTTTEEAFAYSNTNYNTLPFSIEEAFFDWMITTNFRSNLPMIYDESAPMEDKEMLKYQQRGWAKFADIAIVFDWDTLSSLNGVFYTQGVYTPGTVCPERNFIVGRDEYIQAACDVTGKNATPLFHLWGISPSTELQASTMSLPKSQEIKERIEYYKCNVGPLSFEDYLVYHNSLYPKVDYQRPRYDEYINQFDENFSQAIQNQFDLLLETYGLIGPSAPSNITSNYTGTSLELSWEDNSNNETGFIVKGKPFNSDEFSILATTSANSTATTIDYNSLGLYEIQVTAFDQEGLESSLCDLETLLIEPFSLPSDNFRLKIIGESCISSNNGSIEVTTLTPMNYTAILSKETSNDISKEFTNNVIFQNVTAGTYSLCFKLEGQQNYEQCFEVTVTEPEALNVNSKVNSLENKVTLDLSGAEQYRIELNGELFITSSNKITLPLDKVENILSVKTDKDCQGTHIETFLLSDKILIHPNPLLSNELNIYLGTNEFDQVEISLFTIDGMLVIKNNKYKPENGNMLIDMSGLAEGIYMLKIKTDNSVLNYKIIKQ